MHKTRTRSRTLMALMVFVAVVGVARMATALDIGDKAPDFTLPSTTGDTIRLSQFLGKKHVLIQFYTMDFNPTCTANLKARMVDQQQFDTLDIQVLAISSSNPFSQKMFATSQHLAYPLLSDHPDLEVIQHYDVLKRIGVVHQPVARGAYFLVDKQGIVQGKWMNPPGEVVPSETFLQAARERLKGS